MLVARRLLESVGDHEERRFLLAEIALAVGGAARAASRGAAAVPRERVRERFAAALDELSRLLPGERGTSHADSYLNEAFGRART